MGCTSDLVREYSITYAEMGFKVFPVQRVPEETPEGTKWRKKPATRHGHKDASNDPSQVARMFRGQSYEYIGMTHDRFLVIDVDTKDGQPGAETFETIRHRLPAPLAKVTTASGGWHWYYPLPAAGDLPHKRDTKSLPGVDILLGPGGWCVVPPSKGYAFIEGDMTTIAEGL